MSRREYRPGAADVITRRLAMADQKPPKPVDGEVWSKFATLPGGEMTGWEWLRGRRCVARHCMLNAHGCTGTGCGDGAHGADRDVRDLLLDILDLGGDTR